MKKIVLSLFSVFISIAAICGDGTIGNPYTNIGQAQAAVVSGIYYFNINSVAFSTYVEAPGGWVLVASTDGTGNVIRPLGDRMLHYTTALTLQSNEMIPIAVYTYASLGVTNLRFNSVTGGPHTPFDVQTTSSIVINNLRNNITLSAGLPTFDHSMWTGVGINDASYMEVMGPSDVLGLDVSTYHADGNFGGFHWRLPNDENVFYADAGRDQLNLWIKGSSTLPVELVSFNALSENDKIKIEWATASEINSSYFTIEKSLDDINWQAIGKVNGAGNSSIQKNYVFYDNKPVNGKQFYRLKQTDLDAVFKYSGVRVVSSNAKNNIIGVFPNPVSDYFNLKVESQSFSNSSVRLVDIAGQTLFTAKLTSNSLLIDSRKLSKGYYILEINLEGTLQRVKIVKN